MAIGHLIARGANAALDRERRASHLANCRARARAHRAQRNWPASSRPHRPHPRLGIGANIGATDAQIEEHRRRNNRHPRRARIVADALIGQRAHDAISGGQPEGAATRQQDGMYLGHHAAWVEQIGFARAGRAPTHIHGAKRGPGATHDGAAGASLQVGIMPDEDARHVTEIVVALGHTVKLLNSGPSPRGGGWGRGLSTGRCRGLGRLGDAADGHHVRRRAEVAALRRCALLRRRP